MFPQVHQCEHDAKAEKGPKHDASNASAFDVEVRYVACCRIDPTPIGQHCRFEIVKDEVAFRIIRDRVVAVQSVMVLVQGREIEVYAIDDCFRLIIAIGELDKVS